MGVSGFFKNVIGFVVGGSATPVSTDNPLPAILPGNKTGTATLAALNSAITVEVGIKGAAAIKLTGTNAGAVVTFYGSIDNGVTFDIPVNATPFSTGGDNTPISTTSTSGLYTFNGGVFTHIQAKLTTAGAGSFTAKSVATPAVRNIGLPALGSALDTAATNSTGTWTGLAVLKGIWQGLADFAAKSGQMYVDNTTLQYSGQNTTVDFNLSPAQQKARLHQVFIDSRNVAHNGPATTGSVAIWFKAIGSSNWEQLLDETNTAMTVTLATPRTFRFEIAVSAIRFIATGMTAGEDYTPCIVGEF